MFGLSFEKIVLIGIIAAIIIGPSRLPAYAHKLGEAVRLLRTQIDSARDRAAESVGVDDWQVLDPRQYDPRRIVREALVDTDPTSSNAGETTAVAADSEDPGAEAAGRYVITGSSGHPRKRFVAHTTESRAGDEENAAVHSETAAQSGAGVHSGAGLDTGAATQSVSGG
ncbi:twin-arginine translocase TatA/TatE family subunit [Brevibacterium atlanticum]|uniref:twin-arginine translocase TatA/TatE family subunit n=1 Tax=Brevibacterium atlanticum TaxID=2697563 RepID=UPI00142069ED|nr:twin-arginine translocase TatA/TatE family subunit [Brevibacterium atlanticum]